MLNSFQNLLFNQQSAAPQNVPPGALSPQSHPLLLVRSPAEQRWSESLFLLLLLLLFLRYMLQFWPISGLNNLKLTFKFNKARILLILCSKLWTKI